MSTRKAETRTRTTQAVEPAASSVPSTLSWQEEMVVRMSKGLGEDGDLALEFRAGSFPETRMKLALIESEVWAWLQARESACDDAIVVDTEAKVTMVRQLKAGSGES